MRVFVTGASGWIGSALVPELLGAGHQVLGLARSDAAADKVAAAGAEVLRGDVDDLDALRAGAKRADGVVHLAFRHDVAFAGDFATATASDHRAIETFGEALAGSDAPLAIASGLAGLKPGVPATEQDRPDSFPGHGRRADSERAVLALAAHGVRSMSVRFSPTVHGAGDNGFVSWIVEAARTHGASGYVGDGGQRLAAVHRGDAARLVRLGIEGAPAGSVLHAVGEEGVATRELAEAIGRGLDLPTVSLSREQAEEQLGFVGSFLATDMPASNARTRGLLGWEPAGPTLIEDIEAGRYFTA